MTQLQSINTTSRRRPIKSVLVGVIVIIGVTLSLGNFRQREPKGEYFTETIHRGTVTTVVDATGTLQTVVTVQVGSQVSGQIQALYADYNSKVVRGQLLAKIDPSTFEAQVQNSKANLAAAEAHVHSLEADLATEQASLESAKANLEGTRVDRDNLAKVRQRNIELNKEGLVSQNDLEAAKAAADSAVAKYQQAAAAVRVVEAQVSSAEAALDQAKAQVAQAVADLNSKKINLEYTNIYSPIDGVVISRSVDVGQTVAASLQAPLLFVIANDLTKMQVNASVDEADIGRISRNTDVRFTVDAYPNKHFSGKITEIRLNPQTVQSVVTYSVIINVNNSNLELRPGMTAIITFTVDKRKDALRMPNAALRYRPADESLLEMAGMLEPIATPASAKGASKHNADENSPARDQKVSSATIVTTAAPGQLWNPGDKIQFREPQGQKSRHAVIWVLDPSGKPAPKQVMLGTTDGSFTEVVSGDLADGDRVIIADNSKPDSSSAKPATPPLGFSSGKASSKR